MHTTRRSKLIATMAITASLATACSSSEETAARFDPEAFCDALQVLEASKTHEDLADVVAAAGVVADLSPPEVAAPVREVAALLSSDDPSAAFSSPAIVEADNGLDALALSSCDGTRLTVAARDYAYEGVPAEVPAGRVVLDLQLAEGAQEEHQIVVLQFQDGVDKTVPELLALDEEEAMELAAPIADALATADDPADAILLDLSAGRYAFVCFIPTAGDEASPHVLEGMWAEFQAV